jgi:hypothetical protein
MSPARQKQIAIAAALLGAALVAAANAHLVIVAMRSQPACVAVANGPTPAKRSC